MLAYAEEQDWQIQDYRSGRKAARVGLFGAGRWRDCRGSRDRVCRQARHEGLMRRGLALAAHDIEDHRCCPKVCRVAEEPEHGQALGAARSGCEQAHQDDRHCQQRQGPAPT